MTAFLTSEETKREHKIRMAEDKLALKFGILYLLIIIAVFLSGIIVGVNI